MGISTKFVLVTLATGIPAALLTPVLFPVNAAMPIPGPELLPFFVLLVGVESLFFGGGIAFLVLGLPLMRRVASIPRVSPWPAYLSLGYLAISWYPHLGMHRTVGMDLPGILFVDYVFHLPYILAAGIVAHFFVATVQALATQGTLPALSEPPRSLLEGEVAG